MQSFFFFFCIFVIHIAVYFQPNSSKGTNDPDSIGTLHRHKAGLLF